MAQFRSSALSMNEFASPATTSRPAFRWWWQDGAEPTELLRELNAMHEAGFSEVEIAFSRSVWATNTQRHALEVIAGEAERIGMRVATTLGAEWPLRTPNTTAGSPHAAQELQYGVIYIDGGSLPTTWDLPPAFDDPLGARAPRLVAVTLARVVSMGSAPRVDTVRSNTRDRKTIVPPDRSTLLDISSVRDLTGRVSNGSVSFAPGPGRWALFAFWARDTEQGATSFIDRSAASAAAAFLEEHQLGADNTAVLRRVGSDLFEDSLELNADSLFWSSTLLERFVERLGYDVTPYLPVLFAHGMCRYWVPNEEPVPDFAFADRDDVRIRHDYYRLLTDLYISDHLLVLQKWASTLGLTYKSQVAYGQNLEPIRSTRALAQAGGRPEAESLNSGDRIPVSRSHPTWKYALDWQRCVVGGAHQGGTTRVSTELGAQFQAGYSFTLEDYRRLLDKEWAAGITRPFVHGFASQAPNAPWPTQDRFGGICAQSWNDTNFPEWQNWRALTDYWSRGVAVLETGAPRTDIAIYRDGFLTTAARSALDPSADFTAPTSLADTDALDSVGYTVQFLDPDGLVQAPVSETLFPDGPSYRALVVVDEESMPPNAVEALLAAAAKGLRVVFVGVLPSQAWGFADRHRHGNLQESMGKLLRLPTVQHVPHPRDVPAALRSLGVRPRVEVDGASILTQWRAAGKQDYAVVYNTEDESREVTLTIDHARGVHELNLWTGERTPLRAVTEKERTTITLRLAPLDLRVLELGDPATLPVPSEPTDWTDIPIVWRSLVVHSYDPSSERSRKFEKQGPEDWSQSAELNTVAGVGLYDGEVAPTGDDHFRLHLGLFGGSVRIRVRDIEFGPFITSGAVVDLGASLRDGGTIIVEVRTSLMNAMSARPASPYVRKTATRPVGLVGPVKLSGRRARASDAAASRKSSTRPSG